MSTVSESQTDFLANLVSSTIERREQLREQLKPGLVELTQVELVLEALDAALPVEAEVWREEITQRAVAGSGVVSIGSPQEAQRPRASEEVRRQQVIDDLEPRVCALPGCDVDISHKPSTAKYCSRDHKQKGSFRRAYARTGQRPKGATSDFAKTETWLALRDQREGATVGQLEAVGIPKKRGTGTLGSTAILLALQALEKEGRATSEMKKVSVETKSGTQLRQVRIFRHVPPQLKSGAPPDPTNRPRGVRPEIAALASNPALARTGIAPTGNYPLPKEGILQVAVRKAVGLGWSTQLDGKGAHRLRLEKDGQQIFVPMNPVGHHLARKVISEFRKAGVDC